MSPVWFSYVLDVRRRWKSLVVLALLISFASGAVMTAVAGARRGSTALDRLLADSLPLTAVVLPNEPDFDWDAVRELPNVAALTGFSLTEYAIDGIGLESTGFAPTDDEIFRTIERPVILAGRLVDPARDDELVATAGFMATHDYSIGDTLTLRLPTPDQADLGFTGEAGPPAGPEIEATLVGVVRSLWASDKPGDDAGGLGPSPGLFAVHRENFMGTSGAGVVNALVRLDGGHDSLAGFKTDLAALTGREDIDVWDIEAQVAPLVDTIGFESASLVVFAVAAIIAAIFIVGQAVVRHVTSFLNDTEPLRLVGMTPAETRRVAAVAPTLAAVVGWIVAALASVVASRWFPIGTASPFEPAPGAHLDAVVLGIGLLATIVLVAAGATGVASLALRRASSALAPRRSAAAALAVRAGMPVPIVVGSRFALEPGRGRSAVPVRPALLGATIGVLGVLAAFALSTGIDEAVTHPERFGVTYEYVGFVGFNGFDFVPTQEVLPAVESDDDVVAVDNARMDVVQAADVAVSVFTIDPVDRPVEITTLRGRLPVDAGEIAIGPRTAAETGLDVGDTAPFTGSLGTREVTVTGIAFVPAGPHNDYASGGWMTAAGYDRLTDGFKFHFVLVDVSNSADAGAVADRIGAMGLPLETIGPPSELAQLRQVRAVPLFLAAFLLLLALGAVGHALATAVRRRSHDVAVLRAVGMSRRQSRAIVATQATVLGLVGLVAGVPLGVALGRTLWRYVAERTPLLYVPPGLWITLAIVVPAAVLAVNVLALGPSRRAARLRLAQALRAE